MKKIILIFMATTLVVMSCKKPGCIDVEATNYNEDAKTDDGTCIYPEVDPRLPLLGNYIVKDSSFSNGSFVEERTYTLIVRLQSGEEEITKKLIFEGLWGEDHVHYGTISEDYVLTIPNQAISPGSAYNFAGNGSFYGNFISFKTSYNGVDLWGDPVYAVSEGVGEK